jgi:predicted MFS family arabinose efflux permease
MVGIYTGATLGGVGGYVAVRFGWRFGFQLFGGVGVAYCLVLLLVLRDRASKPAAASAARSEEEPRMGSTRAALLGSAGFRVLLAVNVLVGAANWVFYTWLPTHLRDQYHLGLGAAGLSGTAYIQIASFLSVLAAGAWADGWRRRNPRARSLVPAIGYCLAGPVLIASLSTPSLAAAVLGLIAYGIGRGAFDANQMPVVRELVEPRASATAYGLLNFISTTAGGAIVYVAGALKDHHVNLSRVFQACGGGLLVAGLLLLAIGPAARPAREVERD